MTAVPAQPTILVADDDRAIRAVLTQALTRMGYAVRVTGEARMLWSWVQRGEGDLVITDVMMPDENGLDLLPRILGARPDLRVIVMSAQNTLLTAVKATQSGAFEYLPKPFDLAELMQVVGRGLRSGGGAGRTEVANDSAEESGIPLIGRSAAMQDVYRTLARLTSTDLSVVIVGESGTGKELVARALHDYGRRRNGPFVVFGTAAVPQEQIETELFGREESGLTGAFSRTPGRFEQAQGGTLFLDEIGDMPLEAQTRLLRVLQEGAYTPVGGRAPVKTDVRIVAATHRDLPALIREGKFREDLYYRIAVVPIRLPPLRERLDDMEALVRHLLAQGSAAGLPAKTVDGDGIARLQQYRWPGNIRELENLMRRLAALYSQDAIGADVIDQELRPLEAQLGEPEADDEELPEPTGAGGGTVTVTAPAASGGDGLADVVERQLRQFFAAHEGGLPAPGLYDRILREVERPLIGLSLQVTRGNQIKAAKLLGLNRNTLRKKIKDLDIDVVRGLRGDGS